MFIQDLPIPLKVLIRKEFLRNMQDSHGQYVEGYVFAVTSIPGRALLFTAHTIDGAVVSRLPISAFCTQTSDFIPLNKVQLWDCLSDKINTIQHAYLKNYSMSVRLTNETELRTGSYLFTIDQIGGGFSETPDQHKTFNVGVLTTGQLFALPNNRCFFTDNHFVQFKGRPDYLTITQSWQVEQKDEFNVSNSDDVFYISKNEK